MSFDDRLRAAGIKRPVTMLWFSAPQAAAGVLLGTLVALIGAGFVWSFHADPDQIVHGKGAWMSAGHGEAGFLFGLVVAVSGIALAAIGMRRLATRNSAIAITPRGVLAQKPFFGRTFFAWDAIECIKVERHYRPRRFGKDIMVAMLKLYPVAKPGKTKRGVPFYASQIEGGLIRTCRFADTLDRVLALAKAGKLIS